MLKKRSSIKYLLIFYFLIFSILPVTIVIICFNIKLENNIRMNMNNLIENNLYKTKQCLDLSLNTYNDLLYNIYTDDEIIGILKEMNQDSKDININYSKLRRKLNRVCNSYKYVQGITIISENGNIAYYDKLSSSSERSNWINFKGDSFVDLQNTDDNYYFQSKDSVNIGSEKYYMFSIAHKMVDYNDIKDSIGTAIISIDSSVLSDACKNQGNTSNNTNVIGSNIICSDDGIIIYCDNEDEISSFSDDYVKNKENLVQSKFKITELKVPKCNWTIKNIYDEKQYDYVITENIIMTVIMLMIMLFVLVILVFYCSDKLTRSIKIVVNSMKSVEEGNLNVKINCYSEMPKEIVIIADGFNVMVENINNLLKNIKEVSLKQKDAEIKALEAQINPHFLYNTLDTINWKAIENNEFEISDMINSLGKILRYSVLNSNGVVTIKEEMEWLKPYIFLQESRLKNKFELFTNMDKNLENCLTHKLLLQPIIENAISHGLKEKEEGGILIIIVKDCMESVEFNVLNNGVAIDKETMDMINNNEFTDDYAKHHIGISNVICRLKMYYGFKASVNVSVNSDGFTEIKLKIPKIIKNVENAIN